MLTMIVLSSCIEVNYSTPLVDKNRSEFINIFGSDSITLELSGHMKEWNKFWGIINMDDTPKESDNLTLYVWVKNDCRHILVDKLTTQIELLKNGKIVYLENGNIYWSIDLYHKEHPINLNDTLKNCNYPMTNSYCDPYLYSIESKDKQLVKCDTLVVHIALNFSTYGKEHSIQRTDTLYRTVKKWTRFMHI